MSTDQDLAKNVNYIFTSTTSKVDPPSEKVGEKTGMDTESSCCPAQRSLEFLTMFTTLFISKIN